MIEQKISTLHAQARSPGLHEITAGVRSWLADQPIDAGLLTLFCTHTSASLLIHENAAPSAKRDTEAYFARIAPEDLSLYEHGDEGPDDMPAHLRTAFTQTSIAIPVQNGRMMLGTWQGVFLFEHRRGCPERVIALHLTGELT